MKRILFFATPTDIAQVLKRFEENAQLKYVEMGSRTTPNRPIYMEAAAIPNLGISTHETGSVSASYMVSLRDTLNNQSEVTYEDEESQWILALSDNDFAVTLRTAGLWRTGTLLPGNMATLHKTPEAQQLMKWFLSALKKEGFTKVDLYWVGREALEMLKSGRRLTDAERAAPEVDLKLPDSMK